MMQWTLNSILYPLSYCQGTLYTSHPWWHRLVSLQERSIEVRQKTWVLVLDLTFIILTKLSRASYARYPVVWHPRELRAIINHISNVMTIPNANYFCYKTNFNLATRSSVLVLRCWIKFCGSCKNHCFVYIKV